MSIARRSQKTCLSQREDHFVQLLTITVGLVILSAGLLKALTEVKHHVPSQFPISSLYRLSLNDL